MTKSLPLFWIVFLLLPASAQSDAAHATQTDPNKKPAKVYTNDDLSSGGTSASVKRDAPSAPEKDLSPAAKETRNKILKQKAEVAKLDSHLRNLEAVQAERASLATAAPLTAEDCVKEPERCETKRQAILDLARTKKKLEEARTKLETMEDEARKKGYEPSIFDPD